MRRVSRRLRVAYRRARHGLTPGELDAYGRGWNDGWTHGYRCGRTHG